MKRAAHLVTLEDLTRLSGRTYRTIRDRIATLEPEVRKAKGSLYDSRKALALIFNDGQDPDGLDLSQERAALAQMQRRKLELEVAKIRGDLVPRELVTKALTFLAITFRSRLVALPRKLAIQLSPENPRAIEAKIESEAHAILAELEDDQTLPDWAREDAADGGGRVDPRRAKGATPPAQADGVGVG
jgi:phage terminase Nu1 subunit (DNA packaging protein)